MSANKIAETSLSTGTGNFTLAGAWSVPSSFITGNRTFNSFYGLNHRFPYMIQDQLGNWEKGVGYLSGATTLVRERVIDNSLGTTALINFTAGDKLVMVPTDAGADLNLTASINASYPTYIGTVVIGEFLYLPHVGGKGAHLIISLGSRDVIFKEKSREIKWRVENAKL